MNILRSVVFLCLVISAPSWAASGTMIKDDNLRSSASPGAGVLGKVGKGTDVQVLARQGGWTQVSHAGMVGWVRILSVRSVVESGGNTLGGIVQMGTARRDPSRVVAVAGVRGLNEEELRSARFNANELARLQQFASSRADAEQFARSASLRSLEVAYLKPAKREQESRSNDNIWGTEGL